jgi:hypothetical protein
LRRFDGACRAAVDLCRATRQSPILIRQKKHEHRARGARRAGARSRPLHHGSAETRHSPTKRVTARAAIHFVTDASVREWAAATGQDFFQCSGQNQLTSGGQ